MRTAHLLLALADKPLRRDALTSLEQIGERCNWAEQSPSDWTRLVQRVGAETPEILLVELASAPEDLPAAFRELRTHAPRTKIVAIHSNDDAQQILSAMRAGANEFVHPPLNETLAPAVQRMLDSHSDEQHEGRRGQIIGFLSAKGGCGATTLACHVAIDLHRQTQKKSLLADLDFSSGMVAFLTKIESSYSILDAVNNLSRMDESLWKALAPEWKPGITVVPTPESLGAQDVVDLNGLRDVLRFARSQYDWIVLDLGRSFNRLLATLYEELDQLLVVSVMEVTALQGLRTIVKKLTEHGENPDKVKVVLNRTPKTMELSREELEKVLGRPLFATLPNDYPSLYESYSAGTLLAPNSRLGQTFSVLTSKIAGIKPKQPKKKFALFG